MKIHKSWHEALKEQWGMPYIQSIKSFVASERAKSEVYPPEHLVFSAFGVTPFDKVKVVIMGQDPYHGPNQAHGMCFSVERGITIPPSLRNIYKEIKSDLGFDIPAHGNLMQWAEQGVLLLNATLTVRRGEPKSHYGIGWEEFTDNVVRVLCEREDPLVFVLWGRSAQEKCERILNTIDHPHKVLIASHPSPFAAHRFFGCKHFSKINNTLKSWGKTPIDWQIK